MTIQAGQLLIVRRRLTLEDGITSVDTGLTQVSLAIGDDPPLGGSDPTVAVAGVASRVEVKPLAPIPPWITANIHHSEPYLDGATGTVWVDFWVAAGTGPVEVNVLFWDPHTAVTPMLADAYNVITCTQAALRPAGITSPLQGGSNDAPAAAGSPFTTGDPADADGQLVLAMFALRAFGDYADPVSDPVLSDAGWTTVLTGGFAITGGTDGMKFVVAYRISNAAVDPATYGFTSGGAGWRGAAILSAWVPAVDAAPIQSVATGVAVPTEVDPLVVQAPSLNAPAGALPTLICGYISSNKTFSFTSDAGMTGVASVSSGSAPRSAGVHLSIFSELIAAAGATGTRQATRNDAFDLSVAAGIAFSIALPPTCGIFPSE